MEKTEKKEQKEKLRFKEDYRIDTYRVDQNKIGHYDPGRGVFWRRGRG